MTAATAASFKQLQIGGGGGGGATAAATVHPVSYEAEASQRLVEAAHGGDAKALAQLLENPLVDVNYAGTVLLRSRRAEVVLREEAPCKVRFDRDELRTDASALFLAAHAGNLPLVRKLLSAGGDVNLKMFRGFATTEAVREGRTETVELLLRAGASQPACEEALSEAAAMGNARLARLLMDSDQVRPHVAVHALATASSLGFFDVVETLLKCGVDANAKDRMLLRSLKPSLHANLDCTALGAAIVGRQGSVVRHLLQSSGVRRDAKLCVGGWSWDTHTGEELRVGAGLAEPYSAAWCAVEYFESTGTILRMLLQHHSPNALHLGRSLLHHAVLCSNAGAVAPLAAAGADLELPVTTGSGKVFRASHIAARLGHAKVLQSLIDAGCDVDARTDSSETPLMLCARFKQGDCLRVLAASGADIGLLGPGDIRSSDVQQVLLEVIRSGKVPRTSNPAAFSPMRFAARHGDVAALEVLVMQRPEIDLDEQDEKGFTALMVAAKEGHVDAFRFLVFAGANTKLANRAGETAVVLSKSSNSGDMFEQVLLDFALNKGAGAGGGFCALHCAARRGDMAALRVLIGRGGDVNAADGEGYTPLMLAAREGHAGACELLIAGGARCDVSRLGGGETALSMVRANRAFGNPAEAVIMDEMGRKMVLEGGKVKKHTKRGRGRPHGKTLKMSPAMSAAAAVLRWGKGRRRNVVCVEAEVGGSSEFVRNRKRKGDAYQAGLFRVVTTKGREVHFVCDGGDDMAELWVRGIKLVTRSVFGVNGGKCK